MAFVKGSFERVPLCFMGAACVYGWTSLLSSFSLASQGESMWGVAVPFAMALLWRLFERDDVRRGAAAGFAILGVGSTLVILHVRDPLLLSVGIAVRLSVSSGMLLLWCWIYGKLPMNRSAIAFGGMQMGSFLLAVGFLLLPKEAYEGIALCLPVFCSLLFLMANDRVSDGDADRLAPRRTWRVKSDLHWKLLVAAFACAFAYGLEKAAPSAMQNVVSFGLSGFVLIAAVTIFRKRVSTQLIFNIALPLIVAGLAVGSVVGSGLTEVSAVLTGFGYALMMALLTITLADRSFRFGMPAIWSIGIMRAVLGGGRLLGDHAADAMRALVFPDALVHVGALLAVLVASIVWMQDAYSAPRQRGAAECDEGCSSPDAKRVSPGASSSESPNQDIDVLRSHVLERCAAISAEYRLSKREAEILEFLAFGWSVPRIEQKLVVSNSTVKTHVRHIYTKLGIHSRDELKILVGVDLF